MSDDALLAAETVSPERALRRLFLTLFLRGRSARGLSRAGMPSSVGGKLATVLAFYAFFGCMAFTLMAQPVFAIATYLHAMTFVLLGLIVATHHAGTLEKLFTQLTGGAEIERRAEDFAKTFRT